MKKVIIGVVLVILLPTISSADYDANKIKQFVTKEKIFKVTGWKRSDNNVAWIAKHNLKNAVMSITKDNAGIMTFLSTSAEATDAMVRCLYLGDFGLNIKTEKERNKLSGVIRSATKGKETSMKLNNVKFKASAIEIEKMVALTCQLTPNKN